MRLDYDGRLRLRRTLGAAVPVVLVPAAVWFYAVTPPSALAEPPSPAGAPDVAASVVPASGAVLRATALEDGSFDVVETVRLTEPVVQVRLAPPDLSPAGTSFAQAAPTWTDVEVVAPDQEATTVPEVDGPVTVALASPTTTLEVRYRVSGAAVRTLPSPDGRALGALVPLTDVAGLVFGFQVDGDPVRTITCPRLPAEQALCGLIEDGTFVTEPLPSAQALVLVQLDLGDR